MRKLFTIFFLAMSFLAGAQQANAKSYSIDNLDIVAELQADGSAYVTEKLTMSFNGEYSRFTRDLPILSPVGIESIEVSENGNYYELLPKPDVARPPGRFAVSTKDGKRVVEFYYQAKDTTKTFQISYLVTNAVQLHNDVAELNRKFIDVGWDAVKKLNISILLPPGADKKDLLIWSHAPLNGLFTKKSGEEAVFTISSLPKNTFVELRVVAPLALFPDGTRKTGKTAKDSILKQEKEFADAANKKRDEMKRAAEEAAIEREKEEFWNKIYMGVSLFLSAFIIFRMFAGKRKRPSFPLDSPKYYRDIPSSLTPAEAGELCRVAGIISGTKGFITATLLDLCVKGFYSIQNNMHGSKKPEDIILVLATEKNTETLKEHEQTLSELIRRAFDKRGSFAELEAYIKDSPEVAYDVLAAFDDQYRRSLLDTGYLSENKGSIAPLLLTLLLCCANIALAIFAESVIAILLAIFLLFASAFVGMTGIAGSRTVLSAKGWQEAGLWRGLKNFFNDFTLFDEKELPELPVWQRFLAYAVALGEGKKLLKTLLIKYPQIAQSQDDTFAGTSFLYYMSNDDVYNIFDSVGENIASVAASVSSSDDSGSYSDGGDGGGSSSGDSGGDSGGGGSAD